MNSTNDVMEKQLAFAGLALRTVITGLTTFSVRDASVNDVTIPHLVRKRWCDSTESELNNALMGKRSWFSAD
jgi:hypothetical protein